MFAAADVRDVLDEMTDLDYGTRNRIAWAVVDRMADRMAARAGEVGEVLAAHWWQQRGMGYGSPDRCSCGAETRPEKGDDDVSDRRARAFAKHQAEMVTASGLVGGRADEARAEAWDEAVRECHGLGWLHDFALSDALERNPVRGGVVSDWPVRQKSAKGQPPEPCPTARTCRRCKASFLGLAAGKTGERGLWSWSGWWCSQECYDNDHRGEAS
jgi:hypothetical protein